MQNIDPLLKTARAKLTSENANAPTLTDENMMNKYVPNDRYDKTSWDTFAEIYGLTPFEVVALKNVRFPSAPAPLGKLIY